VEQGAGEGDHDARKARTRAEVERARVPGPHGTDRPKAVQDVPLSHSAGIGRRDESRRQGAPAEELLEAFESGGCLLREFDPQMPGGRQEVLVPPDPCFT
jgi:hypothetical protein